MRTKRKPGVLDKVVAIGLGTALLFGGYRWWTAPGTPSTPTMTQATFSEFYNDWMAEGHPCGSGMGKSSLLLSYAFEANEPDSVKDMIEGICN